MCVCMWLNAFHYWRRNSQLWSLYIFSIAPTSFLDFNTKDSLILFHIPWMFCLFLNVFSLCVFISIISVDLSSSLIFFLFYTEFNKYVTRIFPFWYSVSWNFYYSYRVFIVPISLLKFSICLWICLSFSTRYLTNHPVILNSIKVHKSGSFLCLLLLFISWKSVEFFFLIFLSVSTVFFNWTQFLVHCVKKRRDRVKWYLCMDMSLLLCSSLGNLLFILLKYELIDTYYHIYK